MVIKARTGIEYEAVKLNHPHLYQGKVCNYFMLLYWDY